MENDNNIFRHLIVRLCFCVSFVVDTWLCRLCTRATQQNVERAWSFYGREKVRWIFIVWILSDSKFRLTRPTHLIFRASIERLTLSVRAPPYIINLVRQPIFTWIDVCCGLHAARLPSSSGNFVLQLNVHYFVFFFFSFLLNISLDFYCFVFVSIYSFISEFGWRCILDQFLSSQSIVCTRIDTIYTHVLIRVLLWSEVECKC